MKDIIRRNHKIPEDLNMNQSSLLLLKFSKNEKNKENLPELSLFENCEFRI